MRVASGNNLARGKTVTALDSIEAPPRWQRINLVDGHYIGQTADPELAKRLADTETAHADLINSIIKGEIADKRSRAP